MQIRRLRIKGFRGIQELEWLPGPGLNCLTGPGDVGKSTVLEAVSTLLTAAPGRVASEYDYHGGAVSNGFLIEALVGSLGDDVLRAWSVAPLWTWQAKQEIVQADPDPKGESVLCIRARGTVDLEIEHFVVDPSEGEISLSPSKRQLFGLSTMAPATSAFRELRMSRGSLLARNIDRDQLRGLVTEAVQTSRESFTPPAEVKARLAELSAVRAAIAPGTGELTLAMLSPLGQSLLGTIGLFSTAGDTEVPLLNAGLGTQQLTLFTLATSLLTGAPLFVGDEIESGLEPFRQRDLLARIRSSIGTDGQAFVTSHSPAAVGEMRIDELYRLDSGGNGVHRVAAYPEPLRKIKEADPEALLSRIPLLVEGETELGLLDVLLTQILSEVGTTLGALGVRLVYGGGQPQVFKPLRALREMRLQSSAFLDSEVDYVGRRQELIDDPLVAYGTYSAGRCLEEALSRSLSIEALDAVIAIPGPQGRDLSGSRYQQLNELAGAQSRKCLADLKTELKEDDCRDLFAEAANRGTWFKSRDGGAAIARFLLEHHPSSQIPRDAAQFWTFVNGLMVEQLSTGRSDDGTARS